MSASEFVLRELGQLYDFRKELAKFRFREGPKSDKAVARDRKATPFVPRSAVSGRKEQRGRTSTVDTGREHPFSPRSRQRFASSAIASAGRAWL